MRRTRALESVFNRVKHLEPELNGNLRHIPVVTDDNEVFQAGLHR